MKSSENKHTLTKYLAMWDMYGLEVLFDLSDWERKLTWSIIKDEDKPPAPRLNEMLLRARVNSQRCYEIYIFEADSLGFDEIKKTFESDPQFMADFIRVNGTQLYSDYVEKAERRVF